MVKGTTRQVIVVDGVDKKVFDKAFFLVRDDVLMKGGITEDVLLKQARDSCQYRTPKMKLGSKIKWSLAGAAVMGCFWLLTILLL